jgi:hypothetical protein
MEIAWTEQEHREITSAAASRGTTFAQFVRDAAIVALVTPPRVKKASNLRPGGSKWLWARIHEEVEMWKMSGCEGEFKPLHPLSLYVKEITKGTHLNEDEAADCVKEFLYREEVKLGRLVKKTRDHWLRQNRGRVDSETSTSDDQDESID